MATSPEDGETLESLLNKATNPANIEDDWECIMRFCDKVNYELEGVMISIRLLSHKVQSPQEREAMQALNVLQACVKNCGENFHNEMGKFRFLNELIKIVSPKYLGMKTTQIIQDRVIVMLYTWSIALKDQLKIRDAYQMLKKQGIVTTDPKYDSSLVINVPPPRDDKDMLFTDEEKKKQLEKLLKSKRPEDLQAANRLIKSVVKEDDAKMDKLKKRSKILGEVSNNVRLLNEMLTHFHPDESVVSDMQMMKELYDSCQKLRPSLFRLASDTDDDEAGLMEILRANDDLSRVMQSYEKIVLPKLNSARDGKADGAAEPDKAGGDNAKEDTSNILDLAGLSLGSLPASNQSQNGFAHNPYASNSQSNSILGGVDDNLFMNFKSAPPASSDVDSLFLLDDLMISPPTTLMTSTQPISAPTFSIPKLPSPPQPAKPMFSELGDLSRGLMEKSLGSKVGSSFVDTKAKPTLLQMTRKPEVNQTNSTNLIDVSLFPGVTPLPSIASPPVSAATAVAMPNQPALLTTATVSNSLSQGSLSNTNQDFSLNDVFVTLESIRPSTYAPLTVYDNNGIRVMLHFAKDHATATRKDTLVSVVSIMSTRTNPVQNILFQAAAPKIMKVKLQPPSNTELPAFNPIISHPPITQVLIIANPNQKEVKIRYKLDYRIDDQTSVSDSGMITAFPPPENWGKL